MSNLRRQLWSRRLKKLVIYSLLGKIQQSYMHLALRLPPLAHDSNAIQRHYNPLLAGKLNI